MEFFLTLVKESRLVLDERTKDWFLMNPVETVSTAIGYLVIVYAGMAYMKNQKEMDLKYLRAIHNLFLTLLNLYMVTELLRQASLTSWYGPIVRDERGTGVSFHS